ncbi:MAG: MFS transporter [Flavobacteriales bacterium]|nr:MFS transporter [Flavobacteriales bacterium]
MPAIKGDPKVIRAWTFYDWANSVYSLTITSAVFPIFYAAITKPEGVDQVMERWGVPSQSLYSYALSAGFLVVAFVAPLLSGIADSRGNKLAYLKFFCYLGAASCAGLACFSLDGIWWGLALVATACIGFSGSLVFYDAFLVDIAGPDQHDKVSARGYTMGYIGSVILLIINLLMVMNPDDGPTTLLGIPDRDGLPARLTFITVGIWWAAFAQIAFRRLPKRTQAANGHDGALWSGYRELRKVWGQLRATVRLKRFLLAFFVFNMGIQTVMYLAVTFAEQEIKGVDESGAIVPIAPESLIISILLIQLVAAVGASIFVRLSARFGNVRALLIGVVIWVGICTGAYFIRWTNEFYVLACCVGLVMGGCQALSRSTYAKFLPPTKDTASFFSFYDVSYYLGTVLGTLVYGLIYQLTGDLRNTVIALGLFFVLGVILLLRVPKEETPIPAAA